MSGHWSTWARTHAVFECNDVVLLLLLGRESKSLVIQLPMALRICIGRVVDRFFSKKGFCMVIYGLRQPSFVSFIAY